MMKYSRTLSIAPVITQLSLLYNNTNCKTALYRISLSYTIALVFDITFPTTTHRLRVFRKLCYRSSWLLFLYATMQTRYGNTETGYRGSEFTPIKTWLPLKQFFRVTLLLRSSSLIQILSES